MNQVLHNILLIEDNPGDVWLIEESLRTQGIRYNMRRCETVEDALQVVTSYRADDPDVPHLILLDYNLPGGESLAVIEAAVKNPALAGREKLSSHHPFLPATDGMLCKPEQNVLFTNRPIWIHF